MKKKKVLETLTMFLEKFLKPSETFFIPSGVEGEFFFVWVMIHLFFYFFTREESKNCLTYSYEAKRYEEKWTETSYFIYLFLVEKNERKPNGRTVTIQPTDT